MFGPVDAEELTGEDFDDIAPEQRRYAVAFVKEELKKIVTQIANLALPYVAPPDFKPVRVCSGEDEDPDDDEQNLAATDSPDGSLEVPRGLNRGRGGRFRGRGNLAQSRYGVRNHIPRSLKRGFKRVGMMARDDTDCHYFTCIDFDEYLRSWDGDPETYRFEGLEPASQGRKDLVGFGTARIAMQAQPQDGW